MKKWLQNRFLPMWAKETLLADKRRLEEENKLLQRKIMELEAYVEGMRAGLRAGKRISIINRGGEA